jgi:hypothetical protein
LCHHDRTVARLPRRMHKAGYRDQQPIFILEQI